MNRQIAAHNARVSRRNERAERELRPRCKVCGGYRSDCRVFGRHMLPVKRLLQKAVGLALLLALLWADFTLWMGL